MTHPGRASRPKPSNASTAVLTSSSGRAGRVPSRTERHTTALGPVSECASFPAVLSTTNSSPSCRETTPSAGTGRRSHFPRHEGHDPKRASLNRHVITASAGLAQLPSERIFTSRPSCRVEGTRVTVNSMAHLYPVPAPRAYVPGPLKV